jgi:hypothetical protein
MLVVKGGKAGGPLGEVLTLSGITAAAAMSAGFLTMAALIVRVESTVVGLGDRKVCDCKRVVVRTESRGFQEIRSVL